MKKPIAKKPSNRALVEAAAWKLMYEDDMDRHTMALEFVRLAVSLVEGCEERVELSVAEAMRQGADILHVAQSSIRLRGWRSRLAPP